MPLLDAIPVNVFILGTSILAGVILFLILWQIPDEPEADEEPAVVEPESENKTAEEKKTVKKKSSKK